MCNRDCFNCQFDDCVAETISREELHEISSRDRKDRTVEYHKNPYSQKWAESHREEQKAYAKAYHEEHKTKRNADSRNYYHSHKEYFKEYYKNYCFSPEQIEKRREYARAYYHKRRAEELKRKEKENERQE